MVLLEMSYWAVRLEWWLSEVTESLSFGSHTGREMVFTVDFDILFQDPECGEWEWLSVLPSSYSQRGISVSEKRQEPHSSELLWPGRQRKHWKCGGAAPMPYAQERARFPWVGTG